MNSRIHSFRHPIEFVSAWMYWTPWCPVTPKRAVVDMLRTYGPNLQLCRTKDMSDAAKTQVRMSVHHLLEDWGKWPEWDDGDVEQP